MALFPTDQVNTNPLSAVASARVGPLLLPTHGVDMGYAGTLAGQDLLQRYAQMQNQQQVEQMALQGEYARQQLANTGALNSEVLRSNLGLRNQALQDQFTAQQDQAKNAIQQQQVSQQGQFQQGQLANTQNAQAIQQQRINQQGQYQQGVLNNQQVKNDIASQSLKDKETLDKEGGIGSSIVMGLNYFAGNPKAQQDYINNNVIPIMQQEGMDPKHIQWLQDQAQQGNMQGIMSEAAYWTHINGAVKDSKNGNGMFPNLGSVQPNDNSQPQQSGLNTPGEQSVPLNTQSMNQAQQQLMGAQVSQANIMPVLENFNPEMFTAQGLAQGKAGQGLEMFPGMKDFYNSVAPYFNGNDKSATNAEKMADAQANFKSNILQSVMSTLQQQKGVRFNKMSVDVLLPEVPQIGEGPGVAFSKLATLYQRMDRASDYAASLLKPGSGIQPDSKQFYDKLNNYVNTLGNYGDGKLTFYATDPNGKPQAKEMDYEDIEDLAKSMKQPPNQIIHDILASKANPYQITNEQSQ